MRVCSRLAALQLKLKSNRAGKRSTKISLCAGAACLTPMKVSLHGSFARQPTIQAGVARSFGEAAVEVGFATAAGSQSLQARGRRMMAASRGKIVASDQSSAT